MTTTFHTKTRKPLKRGTKQLARSGFKKKILKRLKDKECPVCKNIFHPANSLVKHCSRVCAYQNYEKVGPKTFLCQVCGDPFKDLPSRPRKFCSKKCTSKCIIKDKVKKCCEACGIEFEVYQSTVKWNVAKYCTLKCFNKNVASKRKKRKQSTLKLRLWRIFSLYIRWRDQGKCISCNHVGYWQEMDAGHYVPRTAGLSLYFDERNVNSQCQSCNRFRHGNLSQYALGLISKYGDTILQELDEKRKVTKKYSKDEYINMFDDYKNRFLKMGGPDPLTKNL